MSITTDRIAKANGAGGKASAPAAGSKSYLFEALVRTLDSIDLGVMLVADEARILHVNRTAQDMLEAKSPIADIRGKLCALQAERTKELHRAIALVGQHTCQVPWVGVPLLDKNFVLAMAHVLPLASSRTCARDSHRPVAVFVTPASTAAAEIDAVARAFRLTPAEARLLEHLLSGASLTEAAAALGVAEATARTHRNHIFIKTGVSRRSDLLVLVARLVPPLRRAH
jgi:DNA-binding CsgD family transcriptional regulator